MCVFLVRIFLRNAFQLVFVLPGVVHSGFCPCLATFEAFPLSSWRLDYRVSDVELLASVAPSKPLLGAHPRYCTLTPTFATNFAFSSVVLHRTNRDSSRVAHYHAGKSKIDIAFQIRYTRPNTRRQAKMKLTAETPVSYNVSWRWCDALSVIVQGYTNLV